MLSRLRGAVAVLRDLSRIRALEAEVRRGERLAALGAIEIGEPDTTDRRLSQPQFNQREIPRTDSPRVSQTQFRSPVSPREMDEPVELDPERKRNVLELHPRLGELDYYALLGVSEQAEKKEIKRAYYTLAPNYHPDKFYGKNLGSFKAKMEAIFAQITFAYETLASAERRAEYDGYLSTQKQTRSMEALLRTASAVTIEEAFAVDPFCPPTMPSMPALEPSVSVAPGRSKEMDRAGREALARKLGVTRRSSPPAGSGAARPSWRGAR